MPSQPQNRKNLYFAKKKGPNVMGITRTANRLGIWQTTPVTAARKRPFGCHAKRLGIGRNIGRKADQKGSDTRALLRRCVRFGAEQKRLGKRQNVGAIANTFFGM